MITFSRSYFSRARLTLLLSRRGSNLRLGPGKSQRCCAEPYIINNTNKVFLHESATQWQKPRGNKIRAVPISSVVVAKANENHMLPKRATFQIVLLVIYLHWFKGKFRIRVSVDG